MNEYNLLKDKTLSLFFTFGVSLKTWYDTGLIDREVLLYNELSKYFKQIYFFTYGGKEDLKFQNYLNNNITLIPILSSHTSKISRIFSLLFIPLIHYKILRNIDIFKTNQMNGSWTAVISKLLFKKKLIVRTGYTWSIFAKKAYSSALKNLKIKIVERLAYFFSDVIIVSSQSDLEYLEKNYNLHGTKKVIPNYVDTDIFKPLNLEKRKDSICFVGRLSKQKNLLSLFEAMIELPYNLTIIGSGKQKYDLEIYAKEKGINVKFLGNLPNRDLPNILNQHEVFVLPSLYEGMPKALLEAMACGSSVIGTDVEGIREVIEHKENGILCGTDVASIREAILMLMNDEKLKKKISRNARTTIEANFSLTKLIETELSLYEKILSLQ